RQAGAVSAASGPARRIRGARAPYHRELDAERRDDPARRRDPDATPVVRAAGRRGAGAPPTEASDPDLVRAAGHRGAGGPPAAAGDLNAVSVVARPAA